MNSMKAMEIYKKIKSADWWYNYSDDYNYYKAGEAECREVKDFIKSNEWTMDDVEMIRNEARNNLLLDQRYSDEKREEMNLWWEKKLDYLFKDVIDEKS
jgi:hypothetical protein